MQEKSYVQKWWLFPVSGLAITDTEPDLAKTVYPSFAIVRNLDLDHMLEASVPSGDGYKQFLLQQRFFDHSFYLAVHHAVPSNLTKEQATELVLLKAEEFMSILMFYGFCLTRTATCGLYHRIAQQQFGWISLEKDSMSFEASFSLRCPCSVSNEARYHPMFLRGTKKRDRELAHR